MFKRRDKFFKIIGLALLLVGQSSVASVPTLMDWYKVMPPNYAQFQSVYGSDLDGMVFSQMLRPGDEQHFSDEPLSSEKIQLGAKLSDEAYYHCMVWGYHRLSLMYDDDDLDEIANQLLQLCQSHEDVYDIYNILLASDRYNFPMTERKAWQRIQENRANGYDNRDFHKVVRQKIKQLHEQSKNP
ncbi:hypothetical protein ACSF86_04130 [Moraxella bovoculi]|uniref:hypothetical protein n=1 Tax=Moraxella bovoculi TaxID=386891 RepID=UPI003F502675